MMVATLSALVLVFPSAGSDPVSVVPDRAVRPGVDRYTRTIRAPAAATSVAWAS
jgi:hypothetical protein